MLAGDGCREQETMNPDLQHLIRLQELDNEIESARRRIADIPAVKVALEVRLQEQTATVAVVKERLAASQTIRREFEKEVASVQSRLSKYKDQLMEVKTNKEYQAMQKEIATAEEAVRSQEDRILDRMEEADVLSRELKAAEGSLKQQQVDVAREGQKLDEEAARLEREVHEKSATRTALARQLTPQALALFEHVSRQRKGLAVAEARDGHCMVCHVRLRPQVFNEVRRNEALIQCESCLRILYFASTSSESAASQAS
jgi:predicted  nucleic acid-binding Zn-ribbon protein